MANDLDLLIDWIRGVWPILLSGAAKKVEGETPFGTCTAYWAGSVIRIDYKPKDK